MEVRLLVEQHYGKHDPSTSLASVRDQLLGDGFVIVGDCDRFLGILTPADLLRSAGISIGDCLCDKPHVGEDDPVADVLRQMEQAGVCVLPVFRGDIFIGVVRQQRIAGHLLDRCHRLGREVKRHVEQRGRRGGQTQQGVANRGQLEDPLQSEEVPYRKFFEHGLVGMAIVTPDSTWIKVNDRMCQMLGYARSELLRNPGLQLTHPEDMEADLSHVKKLLEGRIDGYTMEKRFIRKDGRVVHTLISVTCTRGSDGAVERFFSHAVDITDRKQAELALHKSELRYRTLFETMAQGVVYHDADGQITSANPAAERILGSTVEQMRERSLNDPRWRSLRPGGCELPGHEHPAIVALRTGEPVRNVLMEVFNPRLQDRVWINVHAIPQFLPGETKPFQVYTTFEDVTERKRIEAALRESEMRFRELAELLPQTVFELDAGGHFTFTNHSSLGIFGYSQEEVAHLHVSQMLAPEDRGRLDENFHKRLAGQSLEDHEYMAMRKDGSRFPVLVYSTPIIRDGRISGLRGIVVDISARKEWEDALRRSEQRYRMLIETALDGVWIVDSAGRILETNESYCRISGYSREELLRMTIRDVDAVETPEQTRLRLQHIQRVGETRFETKHRRKDGVLIDVEVAAKMLDSREGWLVAFGRDITEHKRTESKIKEREMTLLHAARLSTLGEMASGIAHELNQPLSAILSYGDACLRLAQVEPPDLSRIVRDLNEIVSQGERAGLIVRRMRALAKRRQPQFARADLNDAVRNAAALIRWEFMQREMRLHLDLAESLPPVHADPIQIEQVLLNLMRNGIEAMRSMAEGPRLLTLRTRISGNDHVCVEVCDTGVGLPDIEADYLFEPFFTTKPDGLGIGLSISRSIIEAHKGTLSARPNADRGATFLFTLPVRHTTGP